MAPTTPPASAAKPTPPRRGFLISLLAIVVGGLAFLFPFASGLWFLLDPLRRKGLGALPVRVTELNQLPADGKPHAFPIVVEKHDDAWTRYREVPIGAVFLIRHSGDDITAFNATCPHAGCMVSFAADCDCFQCPCHKSAFNLDGTRQAPEKSPSPRDLDSQTCEVRDGGVWVEFQNFQIATPEKKPRA